MKRLAKILLFVFLALVLLVVGSIGAQALWQLTHHRYDEPNSGYYHGSVRAQFDSIGDETFFFEFKGKSEPRWRWGHSTNIIYKTLHFEWYSIVEDARTDTADKSGGSGVIMLPVLAYHSTAGDGVLTRATLAKWLLGATNGSPAAMQSVDTIFSYIEAAGSGLLPAPRHHTYHLKRPLFGMIQHFLLGFGVGGFVYVWMGIWLLLVVIVGRRFRRRTGKP